MMFPDKVSNSERGFKARSSNWRYDPVSQVSNLVSMGPTLTLSSLEERDSDTTSDSEDDN